VERRRDGWQTEWIADPSDECVREQRAAIVRRFLSEPSDQLAEPSRLTTGPIALSDELQRAFVGLRLFEEGSEDPVVSLAELTSAEAALGWSLDELVVMLLASRVRYLEREWRLVPDALARTYAAGRKVVPAGLRPVAVAKGRTTWLCIRGRRDDARLYLFDEKRPESIGPFEAVEWLTRELSHLRERVRRRWLGGEAAAGELLRREHLLTSVRFTPSVEALVSRASGQRVRHPTFGVGTPVSEEGSGESRKVTVLFEDGTRRVVLGRFLAPL
jgi:hypothetical protein